MISRNDPCWCRSGLKWKKCHYPELSPKALEQEYKEKYNVILKTPQQIEGIRHACKVTRDILNKLCEAAKEGVTTLELDELSVRLHKEANAIAAPLGYGFPPYPKTICTSLNEVICHGIPERRSLQNGDIMNIDVSCIVDGYFGDCSRMVIIGKTSEEKERLVKACYESLHKAIEICKPGVMIYEIGNVIEETAAFYHCSVVSQFVGHGVGVAFHEPPDVCHHYNRQMIPLAPGMIFTIEPMLNLGVKTAVIDPIDQWTARTKDGKASAQWEHTILITPTGHEILTL